MGDQHRSIKKIRLGDTIGVIDIPKLCDYFQPQNLLKMACYKFLKPVLFSFLFSRRVSIPTFQHWLVEAEKLDE